MKRAAITPGSDHHAVITEALVAWKAKQAAVGSSDTVTKAFMAPHVRRGMKPDTLRPCLTGKRQLGGVRGRKPNVNRGGQDVITQSVASADRGNKGVVRSTAVTTVMEINPTMTKKQAENAWDRTIKKRAINEGLLKKKAVAAQATTSMRSMITERQQGRWHKTVNLARKEVNSLNVDDGTGVPFGAVEDHFVVNLDEECVCAADGVLSVTGAADVKKHEKEGGGRDSTTMMKVVAAGGAVGPCFALMTGKTLRSSKGLRQDRRLR